ncbi:DUF167 domain-containing protein [Profundibacter sp.]
MAAGVIPKPLRYRIVREGRYIRIYVTSVPEGGKVTRKVIKLLLHALGVPKSVLTLMCGALWKDKVFRVRLYGRNPKRLLPSDYQKLMM